MAKLEDVLPALREGKKIQRNSWCGLYYIQMHGRSLIDDMNSPVIFSGEYITADNWELVPEPVRVAEYLTPTNSRLYFTEIGPANTYYRQTHPIGQQPEGSVLVPGSEKEVME